VIGKTISHYRITDKLGEGGMGVVYKAHDTKLTRTVALKFLSKNTLGSEQEKARFLREAQAASLLDHPNICTLYDTYDVEDETFIAMAYCDGQRLDEKIAGDPLPVEEAVDIAIQIAEGLKAAHKKGVVHRDIKSANIMLTREGQAKIMDFGLAKLTGRTKLTETATIMGTVDYMSPEQARGETVDHRTDIWSLGVVLYEMLTGRIPFDAESEAALVHKIIYEEPRELTDLAPDLPSGLIAVVSRAMAKDREDRYGSLAEFLDDIRNYEFLDATDAEFMKGRGTTRPLGTARPRASRRVRVGITIGVVAALVCLTAMLIVFLPQREEKTYSSIVVLPFEDMSAAKDQEYFCDGIAEELINALSRIDNLRVIARTSAFSFKGKDIDIQDIGSKLNVEAILEGSVRRSGDRVRVTARLVDVGNNEPLLNEQYEKEMKDIFAIQDEITEEIVDNLRVELLGGQQVEFAKRHEVDPEVYDLYLRGRYFWSKYTLGDTKKAIEYFGKALKKDPSYAPAHAGLADSYIVMFIFNYLRPLEACRKARDAALKALEIDNTVAEAHASLGLTKTVYEWDWEGAEKEFKRAIELSPGYAPAHHYYAWCLTFMGRFEEAIEEMQRARELDPFSLVINRDVGTIFYYARQYDRAIEAHKKTIEMAPNLPYAHAHLGMAYLEKAMYEQALAEFEAERQVSGSWLSDTDRWIGITYARMGRRDKAQKVLDNLLEQSKEEYVPPAYFATLYFALGEIDQGFEWLDKAYEERDNIFPFLKVAFTFEPARSDPRYAVMLEKIGLDD
jgi:serine/threonine-protein kinase